MKLRAAELGGLRSSPRSNRFAADRIDPRLTRLRIIAKRRAGPSISPGLKQDGQSDRNLREDIVISQKHIRVLRGSRRAVYSNAHWHRSPTKCSDRRLTEMNGRRRSPPGRAVTRAQMSVDDFGGKVRGKADQRHRGDHSAHDGKYRRRDGRVVTTSKQVDLTGRAGVGGGARSARTSPKKKKKSSSPIRPGLRCHCRYAPPCHPVGCSDTRGARGSARAGSRAALGRRQMVFHH